MKVENKAISLNSTITKLSQEVAAAAAEGSVQMRRKKNVFIAFLFSSFPSLSLSRLLYCHKNLLHFHRKA
jgi:hypothetical protein